MPSHKWDAVCPEPVGLVRPVRIDPTGRTGPTRGQAAGPHWRTTSHGHHVPDTAPSHLPEQRVLEQSVRLPAEGAVSGWAACRLHRVGLIDGLAADGVTQLPVPLVVGRRARLRDDEQVRILREPLEDTDRTSRYGIPCTVIERAAFDAMRLADDEREAAVVPSMVAYAQKSSLARMQAYVDSHPRRRNIEQARRALELAGEHFRSPREVELALIARLDAGLSGLWANAEVYDRHGRLLGIADLLDFGAGLAIEFDGAEHRSRARHTRDVGKEDAFRRARIEVVRVTGTDLADRRLVVDRILAGRGRALFEPVGERLWLAREPVDWLEQRLQEQEAMRSLVEAVESQPLPDIDELRRM